MSPLLECEGIKVRFGGVTACDAVRLSVPEGQIVGLIGPNGAGKTTLFNVLSRFQQQFAGHVMLRGQNIDHCRPHDMIRLGMARTFQNINLFARQTVLDNILIGSHQRMGNPFSAMCWTPGYRRREQAELSRVESIADLLHLTACLDSEVSALPYGLQKRVELARALASGPALVLLDEPVAGCNQEETEEIREFIRSINRKFGVTIMLVEHDMSMVMEVCDYIYVMNFGANLGEGTPSEIRRNPAVVAAYLGEDQQWLS
jgi:branched-chain amino acid transport system ATP-binding protein